MVSSKAPFAAAVALLAQICLARDHLVFRNVSDSPPRTVTGEQGCYTDFGRDFRGSVPTFSRLYSYTFPVTAYSYFIPSTSTITVTPTVSGGGGGGGGGGGSVTSPITSTSTVTTTTHVTSFGTATTITAGPRFTPLASALNHRRPAGGRPQLQDSGYRANDDSLVLSVGKAGLAKADPPLFPQAVVCEMVIRVFTTSTSTITASYAATTTITLPAPNATTTTTAPVQNATTATTTTTTVTSTITDEVANPTQTVYQACQSDNLVSGHGAPQTYFVEAIHSWHVVREQRIAETAENCCIACQGEADCGGSLYHMFSGICYTFRTGGEGHGHGRNPGGHGGQCRAPGELRSTANVADGAVFVASNGQCGGWWVSDEAPI